MQKFMNNPMLLDPKFLNFMTNIEWAPIDENSHETLDYTLYNGVAIIPIHGLLTKRDEVFSPIFGTTSYDEIFDAFCSALEDPKVEKILLDIDSPGGEVGGLFDLVDFIYGAREEKEIYAFANDHAFSAAYAIASAASKIFINRTSGVGSIGVIATHLDVSEADKKAGFKYSTIYAGDRKNDLSPHEPLTESGIINLQNEVNRLYEIFIETVAKNRKISAEKVRLTEAGMYFGSDAIAAGLADEMTDFRGCLSIIIGGNMEESIEAYRTKILEISKLCKLARAEHKIADFIEKDSSIDEVKNTLLAEQKDSDSNEIFSTIYHKKTEQINPLIAVAKARIGM